jgi:hypothetical protein
LFELILLTIFYALLQSVKEMPGVVETLLVFVLIGIYKLLLWQIMLTWSVEELVV